MTKKTSPKTEQRVEKRVVRQFTSDYRAQVIALIKHDNRSVASVSRELGISSSLIYGWIAKARGAASAKQGSVNTPLLSQKTVLPADYVAEMARLRQENAQLKEERDILKKSLGIFASTSR